MSSLYETLGVPVDADTKTIERAYKSLSLKHHPDREGGDPEEFKKVAVAYKVLIDPVKRERYDETGDTGQDRHPIENVLLSFFTEALNEILNTKRDPAKVNLVCLVSLRISKTREQVEQGKHEGTKRLAVLKKIESRLKRTGKKHQGEDLLGASLRHQIREFEQRLTLAERQLEDLSDCDKMLSSYKYKHDTDESVNAPTGTWMVFK